MNKNLLIRYLNGDATAAEISEVESWRVESAPNDALVTDYLRLWKKEQYASQLTGAQLDHDWAVIRQRAGFRSTSSSSGDSIWGVISRIAAVVAVIFVVSGMLYSWWNVPGFGRWTSFKTGAFVDSLRLPDNSLVFLNRHSALTYRTGFGDEERTVNLKGEGYFEVTADAVRPFRVNVDKNLSVDVVGTAFHINASSGEKSFELNVTDGIVSLNHYELSRSVAAGHRATVNASGIEVLPIVSSNFIAWKSGQIDFSNSSLKQIVEVLKEYYPQIKEVRLNTSSYVLINTRFNSKPLEEVLRELEIHFSKKFKFVDGVLTISD